MSKIKYDYNEDILYIRKKEKSIVYSIDIMDNFIIDLDSNNKVVGLEILNASKNLNISKNQLKEVKEGNISTLTLKNAFGVKFFLLFPKMRLESHVQIPLKRHRALVKIN